MSMIGFIIVALKYTARTLSMKHTLTSWGRFSNQEVSPSVSTRRARRSDEISFDKDKKIFFMLMPRTWFKVEKIRLE